MYLCGVLHIEGMLDNFLVRDFPGPNSFSRNFQVLEILEKNSGLPKLSGRYENDVDRYMDRTFAAH